MAREILASTLTQLGVPTASDATFVTINENIMILAEQKYDEGNEDGVAASMLGNAAVEDVLSGKTFTNSSEAGLTGTMENQGAKTASLNAGEEYAIPAGYHNGSGKITANSLASQTSATATAAKILSGYTAWVNGSKITGTCTLARTKVGSVGGVRSDSAQTINIKSVLPNYYSKLTSNNFFFVPTKIDSYHTDWDNCDIETWASTPSFTYNPSTGVLSVSGLFAHHSWFESAYGRYGTETFVKCDVYAVYIP